MSKSYLVEKTHEVILENKPFERLKAIELVAKLMGWLAPSHQVTETISHTGESSYAGLVTTLAELAHSLTSEERNKIHQSLLNDIAEAQRCLEVLDGFNRVS